MIVTDQFLAKKIKALLDKKTFSPEKLGLHVRQIPDWRS
jgi:hypothetical protein